MYNSINLICLIVICTSLTSYYEQYSEFDYFLTNPELPNPWQTDNTELWDMEKTRFDLLSKYIVTY